MLWLVLFVVVPAYAVLAVAMGKIDTLLQPVPIWNPLDWNVGLRQGGVLRASSPAAATGRRRATRSSTSRRRSCLCFAIGYPVAYYIARHAKTQQGRCCLLLIFVPFWVSYLMRMLAWIGLLAPDGYVNQVLADVGIGEPAGLAQRQPVLGDPALIYGYIPYFILPGVRRPRPDRRQPARGAPATSAPRRGGPSSASPCR